MSSPAIQTSKTRAARHAWHAALLGTALAGCASLEPETSPSAAAPAQGTPAQASPAEQEAGGAAAATPAKSAPAAPSTVAQPAPVAETGAKFEGFLSSKLVARWTGGDKDLDSNNLVSVGWSDTRYPWIKAHITTRIAADLNGRQPGSVFSGLSDLHDQAVDFKLYDAYVDVLPPQGLGQLRIGRQLEYETPEIVHYDGLAFRTHPTGKSEFSAGFYGGIPVRLYQGTSEKRSLLGAFAEERPWKGGRARIDWMHIEDDTLVNTGNGILGLGLWQRFENGWSGEMQYTRLEDQDRDLRLRSQWTSPGAGLTLAATYYQLFQTQNELPEGIDPYTSILLALYPYRQYGISASTELSDKIQLDFAVDARRVRDSADMGEFNRDWERYRLTTVFSDVLADQLDLSLFGDFWDGDGRDTTALGADLSYDTQEQWKFGAGSYYSLYKYDIFQNSERDDVRTWYAHAQYKFAKNLTFELSYDIENDNYETYNALRGGALWRF
ncbi:MAG: hypothetical protein IPJ19_06140 [Planctomycetes bacterium]|nr:hypothetical protein [Planctomycetota bacterium]